jgi:hypothetical protein
VPVIKQVLFVYGEWFVLLGWTNQSNILRYMANCREAGELPVRFLSCLGDSLGCVN